jgi:hypothetical protein
MQQSPPNASELLGLWERAATATQAERDDILLAGQCEAPPSSLGMRNAALVALRARLLGNSLPLRATCVSCSAVAEFAVDCEALSQSLLPVCNAAGPQSLATDGHRVEFRVPDITDLRQVSHEYENSAAFVEALLSRCVISSEHDDRTPCVPQALPASFMTALSHRMDELEPGASVAFELVCPECDAHWTTLMNVGEVLWAELRDRAERLLLEIDALARAYGWTELQVLALSATRRAAYLQLVGAA